MAPPSKPLLCRTNMHHHWEYARNPDGARYERCARCLKERPDGISAGAKGGEWGSPAARRTTECAATSPATASTFRTAYVPSV